MPSPRGPAREDGPDHGATDAHGAPSAREGAGNRTGASAQDAEHPDQGTEGTGGARAHGDSLSRGRARAHGPARIRRGGHRHGRGVPDPPALAAGAFSVLTCAVGFLLLWSVLFGAVRAYAGPALLAFFLSALTYALGFVIFRRIRPVRPPGLTPAFLATAWGLLAAAGVTVYANTAAVGLWGQILGHRAAGTWSAALTAPLNEELLKLAGVAVIAVALPHALRGPVDGFIIGALVGLGFDVIENFLYSLNAISWSGALAPASSVIDTNVVRVVLTGLGGHWAMTAIAGTAVGMLAAVSWRPGPRRALGALGLVLLAMAGHFFFDSPLLGTGLPAITAKVAFLFLSAMAVYFGVRHAHRRRVKEDLAEQGAELGMRRSEARALASRHGRYKALDRLARPDRDEVRSRQEQMVAAAEERAARSALP